MKTVRELLLARHADAASDLDAIRRDVVSGLGFQPKSAEIPVPRLTGKMPVPLRWLAVLWEQLVLPSRYAWAGIAAAWIALLAFNAVCSGDAPAGRQRDSASLAQVMAARVEQQRLCSELVGVVATRRELPAEPRPSPRSDYRREEVYNV
jgi:hypothetical protein